VVEIKNVKSNNLTFKVRGKDKGKGKTIPLQALTGSEGSRRVRLPDFEIIGT
jgi:hypothetical protein